MSLEAHYGSDAATLRRFDGETLWLEGTRALAPGAPVSLVVSRADESVLTLEGRSLGSRRVTPDAPRFEIRARLVNLRKADREWLLAALAAPN